MMSYCAVRSTVLKEGNKKYKSKIAGPKKNLDQDPAHVRKAESITG
jgi:hypothetical protein